FLLLIVFTWLSASKVSRAVKKIPSMAWLRDLMAAVQVSLIAYLSAGAFLGLAYFDYFYSLVLIVAVGRVILARQLGARSSASRRQRAEVGAAPQPQTSAAQAAANAGSAVR